MEWKIFICISALCATFAYAKYQTDLKNDLLERKDYNVDIPPTEGSNGTVKVGFYFDIKHINKVDETSNSISLTGWMQLAFTDSRLTWDPSAFGGIDKTRLPFGKLWLPDIMLINRISGTQFSSMMLNALINSEGKVTAIAQMQLTATCEMDLTYFPYDKQTCTLQFGSWSSPDKSVIELTLLDGNTENGHYQQNPEWELTNSTFKLNEETHGDTKYQYANVFIELTRRSAPYAVKLVIPSVLTAFLILFTFILPSSSGEKIVFCLILLLSLILLSVYLQISVPSNTESVLGEFLTFALFLDFFATIIAVICYNVADALLMRDKLGGPESQKHWESRKRKLKALRIAEYVFFLVFLIIFIIGTAVILCRRE